VLYCIKHLASLKHATRTPGTCGHIFQYMNRCSNPANRPRLTPRCLRNLYKSESSGRTGTTGGIPCVWKEEPEGNRASRWFICLLTKEVNLCMVVAGKRSSRPRWGRASLRQLSQNAGSRTCHSANTFFDYHDDVPPSGPGMVSPPILCARAKPFPRLNITSEDDDSECIQPAQLPALITVHTVRSENNVFPRC
jgi:hypothetical protein